MRRLFALAPFLVGLAILTPVIYALTAETWTEGIFDAESDGSVLVAKCSDIAIECTPLEAAGSVPIAVAVPSTVDEPAAWSALLSAPSPRAPPTRLTLLSA
jgi:hypothetical protein